MNKSCRICIIEEGTIKIFDNENDGNSLSVKIMNCASVNVEPHDGLAQTICNKCLENLDVAFNFKLKCEESDSIFRRWLNQPHQEFDDLQKVTNVENCNSFKAAIPQSNESEESDSEIHLPCNVDIGENTVDKELTNLTDRSVEKELTELTDTLVEKEFTELTSNSSLVDGKVSPNCGIKEMGRSKPKCNKKSVEKSDGDSSCDRKEGKTFICEICSQSFGTRHLLRKHKVTHSHKSHSCHVCGKQFYMKASLKVHERTHSGERPYLCCICGKSFTQLAGLQRHFTSHMDEKPFQCDFCDKQFKLADSLTCHVRIHTMERPYSCQKCGKSFTHHSALNKHVRVHTGEKNYRCPQCGKLFARSDSLAEHVKIHSGERPFLCPTCGSSFGSKSTLKVHMRVHTSERPFHCQYCTKSFTQSSILRRHLRTHTGEKPYRCSACGISFNLRVRLVEHAKIAHNSGLSSSEQAVTSLQQPMIDYNVDVPQFSTEGLLQFTGSRCENDIDIVGVNDQNEILCNLDIMKSSYNTQVLT